jgi:hypothetical protein
MLTRDFEINSLLTLWDYIFSGIADPQTKQESTLIHNDEEYFLSHSDQLINLDYVCIAMLEE